MTKAQFTPQADADLEEITLYIARRNPERAKTFAREIVGHCDRIANTPGVGRARPDLGPGIRSVPHGRYIIFYYEIGAGVEVRHVIHSARDMKALF